MKTRFCWLVAILMVLSSHICAADLPDFSALAEKHSPAVVKIQVETQVQTPNVYGMPPNEQIPQPFRHFFQMPNPQGGQVQQGMGSGFMVEPDGYIVTNFHVVNAAERITVRLNDRREFEAEVVGLDERSDLALIKIQATDLPFLRLAEKDELKVGQWVLAIGSPFALDYSVSHGIVSAIGRSLPSENGENYVPFIQTDVPINPGNSGGPLFNMAGEVVGINSRIYTHSGGYMGLSFAIPAGVARVVVAQLKEHGSVARGWLGVSLQEVDIALAQSFGLSKPAGALVAQIMQDGPADKGGLEVGDVITAFNGKPILFSADLPHLVGQLAPNSKAELALMRNGKPRTLQLVVGELPDSTGQLAQGRIKNPRAISGEVTGPLGLQLDTLYVQQRPRNVEEGVIVRNVQSKSAAAKAGLQPGDVITQLGFSAVRNVAEFTQVAQGLPKGSIQPIRFFRGDSPVFRSIVME
jgi:serine protease Do